MKEKWMVKNKKADFAEMSRRFGISEVIARLMVNRDIKEPEQIEAYLHPSKERLHQPLLMKNMGEACGILQKKIAQGSRIRIIGDYDVDGVVSTYILYTALLRLRANVDYRIPDRIADGYGVNRSMIDRAADDQIDTILTCDNGISAMEQVEYAKSLGMTVIVTDHHDIPYEEEKPEGVSAGAEGPEGMTVQEERSEAEGPGGTEAHRRYLIPAADAVVNPKQPDCPYPFKGLCGAAVAYKLIQALYDAAGIGKEAEEYIPYAAIATVCDVMELAEENRVLVSLGLTSLRSTRNPGLNRLIERNGLVRERLSAYHLGFVIGPCLNATGRLKTAVKGVELLLAKDEDTADALAEELKELNDIRKNMTKEGVEEAVRIVEETGLEQDMVLVIYLPECHESLAGIIAGRIRERYNKPAIVLTQSGENAKGSARSIEAYNIYEELTKCRALLLKFGGHPMAAGMSLNLSDVEEFRRRLNANCTLTEEDIIPKISIDVVMPLGYVTEELCSQLELLEPFGKGNAKPLFAERDLMIRRAQPIGKTAKYFRFLVENAYGRRMEALFFGDGDVLEEELKERFGADEVRKMFQGRENSVKMSVTYYPSINEYNGNRSTQIVIQNYLL
ncbi:MAG: DHH family phosphoesterase [Lachnospiraceae bacterium]|nr:DHH family phosphoesterase [Lachnospiraceae bacterium]